MKHKGLFEHEQLSEAHQDDGTHLNHYVGYPKYLQNIRAAIVSARKGIYMWRDGTNWFSIGRSTNLLKEIIYQQRIPTTFFHIVLQYSTAPIK